MKAVKCTKKKKQSRGSSGSSGSSSSESGSDSDESDGYKSTPKSGVAAVPWTALKAFKGVVSGKAVPGKMGLNWLKLRIF